ncbi:MAG TPA: hypothetical protein VM781_00110, partial [Candidatus Bathyarchaeia archaeon]|nr:hypothetical protein [Candidatus Bathyarchaeia archaeon]
MKPERDKKLLRDGPAYTSLTCSVFFGISCIELGSTISVTQLTAFPVFKIMGVSLVLAAVALLL